jgi:hypothetical protein
MEAFVFVLTAAVIIAVLRRLLRKASTPVVRRIVRYERIGRRHVAFPDNAFANPQGLVRSIAEQAGFAKVRRDMKIVFMRAFSDIAERLDGTWQILHTLASLASKKTAVRVAWRELER